MSATIDKILALFPNAKPAGAGKWKTRCPCHPDQNPSLSISEGADGRVLLHDFGGCSTEAICAAKGIRVADLFPPKGGGHLPKSRWKHLTYSGIEAARAAIARKVRGQYVASWTYHNADGSECFRVLRFNLPDGGKQFRPVYFNGTRWVVGDPPGPLPLYGLHLLDGARRINAFEGERKCETARFIGLTPTTSAHGAKSAHKTDWKPLAGRAVAIWPDSDEAGERYAAEVAAILTKLTPPATVRIVRLPGLLSGSGQDIVDWLAPDGPAGDKSEEESRQWIESLADAAPLWTPPVEVTPTEPEQGSGKLLRTDTGNAELLAHLHGDKLRYDHRRRRWLVWLKHWWSDDHDGEVRRLAKATARRRLAAALEMEHGEGRESEIKFALCSENRSRQDAMIALAQVERPIADIGDGWDADAWLVGVSNGVVDLRTGTLRDGKPEDRITRHIEHDFDPRAECPRWLRFLEEIFSSDAELIRYLHRAVGYSLTGITREQCLFVCYGIGANGKTILMRTIRHAFGPYASDTPFTTFELTARVSVPNDVAALDGKRFVTSSETNEGTRLNEARVKALTGCDPITARLLYKEFFTFSPVCKLWLAVNHKPRVSDDSFGFWRRVRLIPFLRTFTGKDDDKHLDEQLKAEAQGILTWAVRGALDWQKHGLEAPAAVKAATAEYQAESDPLSGFLGECCVRVPGARATASELYKRYRAWADDAGLRERETLTMQAFGRRIGAMFERKKVGGLIGYNGIGIMDDREQAG